MTQRLYPVLLFAATFCLGLGVSLPLVQVDRLYFFSNKPSLAEMIAGLWRQGDHTLSALIALFSILLPVLKLVTLHLAAYGRTAIPRWMHFLSNWSMLDVVLVALLIYAAKTSGLANAATLPGLWFFAASAVLTSLASYLAAPDKRPA